MGPKSKQGDWLDSKEARKELKVSACDLAYLREAGKLRYRKDRNAYGHLKADVQTLKKATAREKKGICPTLVPNTFLKYLWLGKN